MKKLLCILLTATLAVILCSCSSGTKIVMDGSSMFPTLKAGDKITVYKINGMPQRGDIIAFSIPDGDNIPLVKRVIGLGGDKIRINYVSHQLFVNEELLDEPYLTNPMSGAGQSEYATTVPEGLVFVMGDNRNHSVDSRFPEIGCIDPKNIIGKMR